MSNDKGASNEQIVLKIKSKEDVIENMLFLWQQNQGFVHKMAVRYSGFAEVEDLKQEAYIGLCAAVEHYDEEKRCAIRQLCRILDQADHATVY